MLYYSKSLKEAVEYSSEQHFRFHNIVRGEIHKSSLSFLYDWSLIHVQRKYAVPRNCCAICQENQIFNSYSVYFTVFLERAPLCNKWQNIISMRLVQNVYEWSSWYFAKIILSSFCQKESLITSIPFELCMPILIFSLVKLILGNPLLWCFWIFYNSYWTK